MDNEFGRQLKIWRKRLCLSQQQFCLNADISTKHLSYLETGKAQPSLPMVEKISTCLQLSPVDRSMLIHAAGFAADNLLQEQRDTIHSALKKMSAQHEPYPSIIADIHLNPEYITQGTVNLLQWLDLDFEQFPNAFDLLFSEQGIRQYMPEWQVTVEHSFLLIKAQLPNVRKGSDFDKNIQRLLQDEELKAIWLNCSDSYGAILPMIPFVICKDGVRVDLTLLISTFGLPRHIQLAEHEYQINVFYPNDKATEQFLNDLAINH